MKKTIALFFIFALLLVPTVSFGGDPSYLMMHANDRETGPYVMLVGRLVELTGDKFSVSVIKVLNGKVASGKILVDSSFKYPLSTLAGTEPHVNDFCVMSLKKSGNNYKVAYGVYRADSGDYKTLKLASKPVSYTADIEWYVNSGGTENDFYFERDKVFVRRPNGERLQIYPKPVSVTPPPAIQVESDKNTNMLKILKTGPGLAVAIPICAFAGFIIFILVLGIKNRQ